MALGETENGVIAEFYRKVGRNLMRYQSIEAGLKLILPYVRRDGCEHGDDDFRAIEEEIAKLPLGALADRYNALGIPAEWFEHGFDEIKKARNELCHELYAAPGVDLWTVEGVRRACAYLDGQYEAAYRFYELIRRLAIAVGVTITEANTGPGWSELRDRLLTRLPASIQILEADGDQPDRG